jgi:hypothetical protein
VISPKTKPRPKPGPVTDHFGATSVASALSIRAGATPLGPNHPNMLFPVNTSKQDISTWQRLGHFYLALTIGIPIGKPGHSLNRVGFEGGCPIRQVGRHPH